MEKFIPKNPVHLAIVHAGYLQKILKGEKTIECRLNKVRCAPHGRIHSGQTVYFKAVGGPIGAMATVKNVRFMDQLSPQAIDTMYRQYNDRILGDQAFWQQRRSCRYGTLVFLSDVRTIRPVPFRQRGRQSWLVLDHRPF